MQYNLLYSKLVMFYELKSNYSLKILNKGFNYVLKIKFFMIIKN